MTSKEWKEKHAEDIYFTFFSKTPIKFKDLSADRQYHITSVETARLEKLKLS